MKKTVGIIFVLSTFAVALPVVAGSTPDFMALMGIDHNVGDEAGVQSTAVGDLDGDAVPDLVVLDADSEEVTVFLGRGDGTFADGQLVGLADLPTAVAIADLTSPFITGGDVDGIPDIIVADAIGGLQIFIGRGDGSFDPPDQSFDDLDTTEISGIAVADFDGDGRDDLALLESFDGVYFLCNDAGTMVSCPTFAVFLDELSFELVDLEVGDFNGGGIDVAVVDFDTGELYVIYGNGDGTFSEVVEPIVIGPLGVEPRAVRVGDLDGNSTDDIVVLSFDSNVAVPGQSNLSVFTGAPGETTYTRADFPAGTIGSAFVLDDIDGDGSLDAVVVGEDDIDATESSVYLSGTPQGGFAAPVTAGVEAISGGRAIESADLNGDAKPDLIAVITRGTQIQVLLNDSVAGPVCPGDCNGNGVVAINELIRGVNIALGNADVATCTAVDGNGNGAVAINELIAAVNRALRGC